jgi:hypothetical protein
VDADGAPSGALDRDGRLGVMSASAPPRSGSGTTLMGADVDDSADGRERSKGAAH